MSCPPAVGPCKRSVSYRESTEACTLALAIPKAGASGLLSTLMTKGPDAAKINIILRHEPNKKGLGVSDGDITNAGGETDIEVSFDITIK